MAVPSKKRCKQGSLDGFFKKQRIDSDAGNYKLKCLNHCHNIIKSSKKESFILSNCCKYEKNKVSIMKSDAGFCTIYPRASGSRSRPPDPRP
jgi:hypothetical protein